MGKENLPNAIKMLEHMDTKIANQLFKNPELGEKVLNAAVKMLPKLEKLGMTALEAIPKIAKGFGKAVPVLGGLVSGYDTVRMGTIAATGKWDGKEYKDPEVRALALLGAATNGADTALAIIEATGFGNVDFLAQLGLAGVEVGIDIMVEYFNEHPEKMPKEMRLAIKAGALATVLATPFTLPAGGGLATAAIMNIYGLDGTIDIANELTKLAGNATIKGIDKLAKASAKALGQGLDGTIKSINQAADMIRNPEKYVKAMKKSYEEISMMAKNYVLDQIKKGGQAATAAYNVMSEWLVKTANSGLEGIKEAYSVLNEIVSNPSKYGKEAVKFALDTAMSIGKDIKDAYYKATEIIYKAGEKGLIKLQEGVERLYQLGAKGAEAAQKFTLDMIKKGGEAIKEAKEFIRDVINDPAKYGNMAQQYIQTSLNALGKAALDGIEDAGKAISDLVSGGVKYANEVIKYAKELPDKAKQKILEGYNALISKGEQAIDLMKYIAANPDEFVKALGDSGKKLLSSAYEGLTSLAKKGGEIGKKALNALCDFYDNTKAYFGDLKDRTGKALARFGDTIVDLVKNGAVVTEQAIKRLQDVAKEKWPELKKALLNLGDAGIEQLSNICIWADGLRKDAVETLMTYGVKGFKAAMNLYQNVSAVASDIKAFVIQKLKTAWADSSWSNGYAGIRNLLTEIYDTAMAAGGEAATIGRKMLYEIVKEFDITVARDYIPDRVYKWIKP